MKEATQKTSSLTASLSVAKVDPHPESKAVNQTLAAIHVVEESALFDISVGVCLDRPLHIVTKSLSSEHSLNTVVDDLNAR